MSASDTTTHRYVVDARLRTVVDRESTALVRSPLMWASLVFVGLVLLVGALGVPLGRITNRRMVTRLFPEGSMTEVELGQDSLVISGPSRTGSVPYRAILCVRTTGVFLRLEMRGRLAAEHLPLEILPHHAIEFIRTQSRGVRPSTSARAEKPNRQIVVRDGWAAHGLAREVDYRIALL